MGTVKKISNKSGKPRNILFASYFYQAVEWEMMEQSPFDRGKSLVLKENSKRVRFLEEDEIKRLTAECPPHLRHVVECGIHTGMRRGEILG